MKKYSNATIALILVFTLSTIQSSIAYENSDFDYSIDFPSGWKIQESPYALPGSSSVWASNGSAFVSVFIVDKSSIDDLPIPSIPSIENRSTTTQFLYTKQRTVNGLNGVETAMIFSSEGTQLQAIDFTFSQQNKIYEIVCIAEQSDFSNHEASFQKCIDSFTVTSFVAPSANQFTESNDYLTALLIGIACIVIVSLILVVFIAIKKRKKNEKDGNLVPSNSPS